MSNINLEVLAPAGDTERFEAALDYGADAIYLGGTMFGMRQGSKNFTEEELFESVEKAHKKGKKVYQTLNTLPRNNEIPNLERAVKTAVEAGIDALIVADIGIFSEVRRIAPDMELHASTQTGIVNYLSANAFYNMGAKRIVLARELTLEEIAEIRAKTPKDLEIEVFVHGAMCMSFSGRCLLSQYLTDRDANRGQCAQPCRWKYALMEEKRPGQYFPISEDEHGSYILNAKDMNMIEYIDKLHKAGVYSLKIEGRAKSAYYVSVITNAYRLAVDYYKNNPDNYASLPDYIKNEVYKVSHREYCPGFLFGNPEHSQTYESSGYVRECDVIGIVKECKDGRVYIAQRNKFNLGDEIEIMQPLERPYKITVQNLLNKNGEPVDTANKAAEDYSFDCDRVFSKNAIVRNVKPIQGKFE